MHRRRTLVVAACLAVALLTGCQSKADGARLAPSSETSPAAAAAAPIKAMTIEEKQQLVAENFQPEVPLPFGEVVSGKAQGDNAWDYELVIAAPPAAVASWYQQAYLGRDWQLAQQTGDAQGGVTLTLTKGAAETRVTITGVGSAESRVSGVLGVGAPVLQTQ